MYLLYTHYFTDVSKTIAVRNCISTVYIPISSISTIGLCEELFVIMFHYPLLPFLFPALHSTAPDNTATGKLIVSVINPHRQSYTYILCMYVITNIIMYTHIIHRYNFA